MKQFINGRVKYRSSHPVPGPAVDTMLKETEESEIPRRYYSMNEVAKMLEESHMTIYHWTNYFEISTRMRGTKRYAIRWYTDIQISLLEKIKHQVRVEGRRLWKIKEMIETKTLF